MPKAHHPRRGSLAYSPRKKSKSETPAISFWPDSDSSGILGFAGYKAGMRHVVVIDNRKNTHTSGQEVRVPVTVLDCPPLIVVGYRAYRATPYGRQAAGEVWASKLPKDLVRRTKVGKGSNKEDLETRMEEIAEIKLIVTTQPRMSALDKKRPEVMEMGLGGSLEEKLAFAKDNLGKEVRISDIFSEGDHIDVIAVTKGKGTQGPVKRWGLNLLPIKSEKSRRKPGNLGAWTPKRVEWNVPQMGQMGYHKRTEVNKLVLKLGDKGEEVSPDGGFIGFGSVKGDYVILKGSIPGPSKRLIRLRFAKDKAKVEAPEIIYFSTKSAQGVR